MTSRITISPQGANDATSDGRTNIISNLAVYSKIPPDDCTVDATKRVDYIRAWVASAGPASPTAPVADPPESVS